MPIPHFRYSFAPGFRKLTVEEGDVVKKELWDFFGCTSKSEWSRRKNQSRDMPKHIYEHVTSVFIRYGVPENDIWSITQI